MYIFGFRERRCCTYGTPSSVLFLSRTSSAHMQMGPSPGLHDGSKITTETEHHSYRCVYILATSRQHGFIHGEWPGPGRLICWTTTFVPQVKWTEHLHYIGSLILLSFLDRVYIRECCCNRSSQSVEICISLRERNKIYSSSDVHRRVASVHRLGRAKTYLKCLGLTLMND